MKHPVSILRILLVITLHVLIIGCKKCPEDKLHNKIKRILYDNNGIIHDFRYSYDATTGKLTKVFLKDKIYVTISELRDNIIELNYSDTALHFPLTSSNISYHFFALISNNQIKELKGKFLDTTFTDTSLQVVAKYFLNNTYLDSMHINKFINPLLKDRRFYNFNYLSPSEFEFIYEYNYLNFLTGNYEFNKDQGKYFYSRKSGNLALFPGQFLESIVYTNAPVGSEPIYLLKLNGYHSEFLDNYLVDSVQVLQGGIYKTDKIYKYTYQENKIVRIRIEKQTVNVYLQFDIEYY